MACYAESCIATDSHPGYQNGWPHEEKRSYDHQLDNPRDNRASQALSIPGAVLPNMMADNGSDGSDGQQFRSLPIETTDNNRNGVSKDIKTCPCAEQRLEPKNKRCSDGCIRLCVFEHPNKVRWHAPEKVDIKKDQAGKMGFSFKEVEVSFFFLLN